MECPEQDFNILKSRRRAGISLASLRSVQALYFLWFVYILLCSDKSLYTGSSNNPDVRLFDHKNGKGGRYTRSHKPIRRVYLEELGSQSEALKRENQIKGCSRDKKIKILGLKF